MADTIKTKGQYDYNDLMFVMERLPAGVHIVEAIPAPTSIYESGEYKGREKINPHVTRFVLSTGELCDVFHVKPVYYAHQNGTWRPMSEVAKHYGNHVIELKEDWDAYMDYAYLVWLIKRQALFPNGKGKVLIPSPITKELYPVAMESKPKHAVLNFLTLTAYPDPHTETTTVDGTIYSISSGQSWASAHDGSAGLGADDSSTTSNTLADQAADASGYRLRKAFFLFDTSSLGSGATISAAILSWAFDSLGGGGHNDTSQKHAVIQTQPASNTALVTADYTSGVVNLHSDTIGSDEVAVNVSESAGTYHDFTLTSTGRGWISKTGVTKLGIRRSPDYEATTGHSNAPAGVTQSHREFRMAEYTGTGSDPKLVVTYTASTNVTVNAAVQAATFSIPAYSIRRGWQVVASVLSATFSLPSRTVSLPKTVAPSVLSATFSIPPYSAAGAKIVSPNTQSLTFSIPAYSILKDFTVAIANALTATFSTPAPTVSGGTGATVLASTLAGTFSIPAYTVVVERNLIVTVGVLTATFSIPTLRKVGTIWTRRARSTSANWTRVGRNSN